MTAETPPEPSTPLVGDNLTAVLSQLRRWPEVESPELVAVDGADRLILEELAALSPEQFPRDALADGGVVVLDDAFGALTLGAATLAGGDATVGVWQDSVVAEEALDANAERVGLSTSIRRPLAPTPGTGPLVPTATLAGARVVLLRLPRGLDALAELAEVIARDAADDVIVLAGGMVKHMTHGMNDVLARSFTDVHATRGQHKARVLVASGPRRGQTPTMPVSADVPDAGLTVWAHGGAFAGTKLDRGTRALLDALAKPGALTRRADDPEQPVVVDLGCGTGILATRVALARPDVRVIAADQSATAVASARLTADAAGVGDRVEVLRDDVARSVAAGSVDLVVCNPPFHVGSAVHTGAASKMFRAAARMLRPGGELWTVYNSHLKYRPELNRLVGSTEQVYRDQTFTVTRTTRRG